MERIQAITPQMPMNLLDSCLFLIPSYRHRDHPNYAYAKALKIIRPMADYKKKDAYDLTEEEKNVKVVCIKCNWSIDKNDSFGLIKYFRPCDLVKDK
jgi:hypothetical protein